MPIRGRPAKLFICPVCTIPVRGPGRSNRHALHLRHRPRGCGVERGADH
jgi:hypothetical protein